MEVLPVFRSGFIPRDGNQTCSTPSIRAAGSGTAASACAWRTSVTVVIWFMDTFPVFRSGFISRDGNQTCAAPSIRAAGSSAAAPACVWHTSVTVVIWFMDTFPVFRSDFISRGEKHAANARARRPAFRVAALVQLRVSRSHPHGNAVSGASPNGLPAFAKKPDQPSAPPEG